jgi:hypothetical protein
LKRFFVIFIFGVCVFSPALAQNAITAQRDRLISSYRDCVFSVSLGMPGEKRMVAEQALFACSTEEEALRAWFALGYVQPAVANSIIVRLKMDMKRIILSDPITR